MTNTLNNTITLSAPAFDALDAALLQSAITPELMRQRADQKRAEIDEQLRAEAKIPFEAALRATVESINESIEGAAIRGWCGAPICPLRHFEAALKKSLNDDHSYSLICERRFVNNTLSMRDYVERVLFKTTQIYVNPFETYFSYMIDSRLEHFQKSREVFPLWLADKLAPIFRKTGFKVSNTVEIRRKDNTKYVALVMGSLEISW
jgi:hypothetical protein